MGTIARGRGAGLEKYSLCGGACHSRPGPRAAGWALLPQLQGLGRWAPEPAPGLLDRLKLHSHLPGVTLQHSPDRAYSGLILTANVQPRVCTTQAQSRPEKIALSFVHLSAHLVVLGPHCPTDPYGFQRSEPLAQTSASEMHRVECGLQVLHMLGVASNPSVLYPKQHPPRLGTCRPSQEIVSCTRLAHSTH